MGATRRDKNRVTLVLRQIIHSVFNLPEGKLPEGKHLPSLLIVQAAQPCFLDDMSVEEPAVWLRSHKIVCHGRMLDRVEGEPVGALLSTWRQARRDFPELFGKGVLLGGLCFLLGLLGAQQGLLGAQQGLLGACWGPSRGSLIH